MLVHRNVTLVVLPVFPILRVYLVPLKGRMSMVLRTKVLDVKGPGEDVLRR